MEETLPRLYRDFTGTSPTLYRHFTGTLPGQYGAISNGDLSQIVLGFAEIRTINYPYGDFVADRSRLAEIRTINSQLKKSLHIPKNNCTFVAGICK